MIQERMPMAPRGLHFMEEVCTEMLGSEGNEQLRGPGTDPAFLSSSFGVNVAFPVTLARGQNTGRGLEACPDRLSAPNISGRERACKWQAATITLGVLVPAGCCSRTQTRAALFQVTSTSMA